MGKLETTRPFPGKTADQVYKCFEPAYKQAGFVVWKRRPIAWLDLAKKVEGGVEIQSNLSARPGIPPVITLSLTSSEHTREQLEPLAEAIWQGLEGVLK